MTPEELEAIRARDARLVMAVEPFAGEEDVPTLAFPADHEYLLRALKDRRALLAELDRIRAAVEALDAGTFTLSDDGETWDFRLRGRGPHALTGVEKWLDRAAVLRVIDGAE